MANPFGLRADKQYLAIFTAPSINKTPRGPSTPAVPYPVLYDLSTSQGTIPSVRLNGQPVYVLGRSTQPHCTGDEQGTAGGVRSGTFNGEVKPTEGSGSVRIAGQPIVRAGDACTLNSGNCPGVYVALTPSISLKNFIPNLQRVRVSIQLVDDYVCPDHPSTVRAIGKPDGGRFDWIVSGAADLTDKAGHPTSQGSEVHLRALIAPDHSEGNIVVSVKYTHPDGEAKDTQHVPIHSSDFDVRNSIPHYLSQEMLIPQRDSEIAERVRRAAPYIDDVNQRMKRILERGHQKVELGYGQIKNSIDKVTDRYTGNAPVDDGPSNAPYKPFGSAGGLIENIRVSTGKVFDEFDLNVLNKPSEYSFEGQSCALVIIPGMFVSDKSALYTQKELNSRFGVTQSALVPNYFHGPSSLVESFGIEAGEINGAPLYAAQFIMKGLEQKKEVWVVAHSQGTAIFGAAMDYLRLRLTDQQLHRIHYQGFGSETFINREKYTLGSIRNVWNMHDPVPLLGMEGKVIAVEITSWMNDNLYYLAKERWEIVDSANPMKWWKCHFDRHGFDANYLQFVRTPGPGRPIEAGAVEKLERSKTKIYGLDRKSLSRTRNGFSVGMQRSA